MKRFITVLMSAMIALSMMPAMAFAAEPEYVAAIGNDKYETLDAAINAVTDSQEITLLADATPKASYIWISKPVTINLNTHNIISEGDCVFLVNEGGNLEIKGTGEVSSAYSPLYLYGSSVDDGKKCTATIGEDVTIKGQYGIINWHCNRKAHGVELNLNGSVIGTLADNEETAGIFVTGNLTNEEGSIPILNIGEKANVSGNIGIALNGYAQVKVADGAVVTGHDSAIEVRSGKLEIEGGKFTATSENFNCTPNGSGTTTEGAAIAIAQHTTKKNIEVTINGGEFNGVRALNESNPQKNDPAPQVSLEVNGGVFNGEIFAVDASGFIKAGTFNDFSVLPYLAKDSNVTIKLDKNMELANTQTINSDVTIDLNGHKITASDCRALHIVGGNVKITGEGTVSSNVVDSSKNFSDANSVIRVGDNSGEPRNVSLEIGENVDVTSNHCYGVTVFGSNTKETVVIDGAVKVTGDAPALSGNGSAVYGGTEITVNGTVTAEKDNAIYHPQAGTLTINGTVIGKGGIEAKSGNTEVSIGDKAVITATANETSHVANSNGCSSSGYALAAVKNDAYAGNTKITIKGGKINGPVDVLSDNDSNEAASIEITGGVFSSNPKTYVPVGTNIYLQKTGKYFVGSMPASTSGYNAWALQNGVYEETYVAPAEPETPDAPVIDNSGSGDNASTNVDASGSTVVTDGKAEASIDSTTGDKIVENAKENNVADVVIKAETEKGDSTGSTVALPESTVQALAKDTEASVTIKTDSATVTLDKDAVKATAAQAGDSGEVKLVVETVENTEDTLKVQLTLVTSKGTVSDFQGGNVTVTVPVDPELAKKELVCVYIDDNDKYTMMEGSLSADGKSYTFTTGHFSTYAILEKAKADEIIADQNKPSDIASAKVTGVVNKTYTGKSITQNPVVTVGESKLVKGTDYTVSYKNNVNAGVATLTIKGAGSYTGTITKTFKINPKGTSISKVTGQKKAVKVVWKKQLTKMKSSYVSGYQVQYSTSSKFTSGTSKYANAKFSKGRTTKTIKNLKAGKKYYVRVRTYKTVDGTKYYSSWSKAKSVKTK